MKAILASRSRDDTITDAEADPFMPLQVVFQDPETYVQLNLIALIYLQDRPTITQQSLIPYLEATPI